MEITGTAGRRIMLPETWAKICYLTSARRIDKIKISTYLVGLEHPNTSLFYKLANYLYKPMV
jgi:hypothetical protein